MTTDTPRAEPDTAPFRGAGEGPAELGECVNALMGAVAQGVSLAIAQVNLDEQEFALLRQFSQQREWTATQLVNKMSLDPSRMSRTVDRLVRRRLMRRSRSKLDRRIVNLTLTESGQRLMEEALASIKAYEAMLLRDITGEEMSGFYATARKVTQKSAER